MTLPVFLAVAVAGGVGAGVRLLLDEAISLRSRGEVPWATVIINVSGSLVLGVLTGLAVGQLLPESWHLVIGSGFLGGFTTFSTASFETVRLLQERRWKAGVLHGLGMLLAATCAAGIGLWLGALW